MKTVVVIGSGPSGDRVSGDRVDSHTVVRMWNHEWQPAERYGSRYDHGLITTMQDAKDAPRRPTQSWLFYNVARESLASEIDGTSVTLLRDQPWFHRAMAQGAWTGDGRALKFTRGFAAVAAAIQHLRPGRVVALGMDILRNGATGPQYYDSAALTWYVKRYPKLAMARPQWAANELPAGLSREGPHDYAAEAVLIRELAAEAQVELVWELQ